MIMWIYTIEPSLEIIQFEASETRGEYKVAYSEIIYDPVDQSAHESTLYFLRNNSSLNSETQLNRRSRFLWLPSLNKSVL